LKASKYTTWLLLTEVGLRVLHFGDHHGLARGGIGVTQPADVAAEFGSIGQHHGDGALGVDVGVETDFVLQRFGGDLGGFDFEGGDGGLEFALVVLVVDAGFEVPVAVGALRELAEFVGADGHHGRETVVQAFGWELDLDLNLCGIGNGGGIGRGCLRAEQC
jgi:hypothetical protein